MTNPTISDAELMETAERLAASGAQVTNAALRTALKERFNGRTAANDRIAATVRILQVRKERVASAAAEIEVQMGGLIDDAVQGEIRVAFQALVRAVVGENTLLVRREAGRHRRVEESLAEEFRERQLSLEAAAAACRERAAEEVEEARAEAAAEVERVRVETQEFAAAERAELEKEWADRKRLWERERETLQAARDAADGERRRFSDQLLEAVTRCERYEARLEAANGRVDDANVRAAELQNQLLEQIAHADRWRERAAEADAALAEEKQRGAQEARRQGKDKGVKPEDE